MELYAISSKFKKYLNQIFSFCWYYWKKIINKLQDNKIDILDFLQHIKNNYYKF